MILLLQRSESSSLKWLFVNSNHHRSQASLHQASIEAAASPELSAGPAGLQSWRGLSSRELSVQIVVLTSEHAIGMQQNAVPL